MYVWVCVCVCVCVCMCVCVCVWGGKGVYVNTQFSKYDAISIISQEASGQHSRETIDKKRKMSRKPERVLLAQVEVAMLTR